MCYLTFFNIIWLKTFKLYTRCLVYTLHTRFRLYIRALHCTMCTRGIYCTMCTRGIYCTYNVFTVHQRLTRYAKGLTCTQEAYIVHNTFTHKELSLHGKKRVAGAHERQEDYNKEEKKKYICQVSCVTDNVPCFICHKSHVMCHLSQDTWIIWIGLRVN